MRRTTVLVLMVLAGGCRGAGEPEEGETPPASALAPIAGLRLDRALRILDEELVAAIRDGMDEQGVARFERAEAVTDRLLETQFPFAWLRAGSYRLDARLRQIQALADRIVAQLGSRASPDSVMADLRRLRQDVVQLRQALAQGGGAAPPPLERLLAGRDTLDLAGAEGAGGE